MASINITTGVGAAYTWTTPAGLTWASAASGKAWADLYLTAFAATVTEDTATIAELPKKEPTKKSLDNCSFADLLKKASAQKVLETLASVELRTDVTSFIRQWAEAATIVDVANNDPGKVTKDTFAIAEQCKATSNKVAKESIATAEVLQDIVTWFHVMTETMNIAELRSNVVSFQRTLEESFQSTDRLYSNIEQVYKRILTIWASGNLWTTFPPNIYNNLAIPATRIQLAETYNGNPIYRLTMTPTTQAQIDSLKANLWNHGIYGAYQTYSGGIPYCSSVMWRVVDKAVEVGGGASNMPGWGVTTTIDIENGWKRSSVPWSYANDKTDNKFWSFRCPTIILGDSVSIDWTMPKIEKGVSSPSVEAKFEVSMKTLRTLTIVELYKNVAAWIHVLAETLAMAENYSDVAVWQQALSEAIALVNLTKKTSESFNSDSISVSDSKGASYSWAVSHYDWNSIVSGRIWDNLQAIGQVFDVDECQKRTAGLGESNPKSITNPLAETLNIAESSVQSLTFIRLFAMTLGIAEKVYRAIGQYSLASMDINESYSDTATFIRNFSTALIVTELLKKTVSDLYKENASVSDRGINNIGRLASEAATMSDTNNMIVVKKSNETAVVAEGLTQNAGKIAEESLTISEVHLDVIAFVRLYATAMAIVELAKKTVTIPYSVSVTMTEDKCVDVGKNISELVQILLGNSYRWETAEIDWTSGLTWEAAVNKDTIIHDVDSTKNEIVNLAEKNPKSASKPLFEALLAVGTATQTSIIGRLFASVFAIGEFVKKSVGQKAPVSLNVSESYSDKAAFIRKCMEIAYITDRENNSIEPNHLDAFRVLLGNSWRWDSVAMDWALANFDWHNAAKEDSISWEDLAVKKETITVDEVDQKAIALAPFRETFSVADTYWDIINFMVRVAETLSISELSAKQAGKVIIDNTTIADAMPKAMAAVLKDEFDLNDDRYSDVSRKAIAALNIAAIDYRNTFSVHKDSAQVTNQEFNMSTKKFVEALSVSSAYVDFINFMIKAIENITLTETPKKSMLRPVEELFTATGKIMKNPNSITSDGVGISDIVAREADFNRILSGSIHLADTLSKHLQIPKKEAIRLMSEIVRNANAIISDIVFSTGDMSVDEFAALAAPAGFEAFRDFISGDLEYKDALVKIIMDAGVTTGRPLITDWKVNVDVPDVPDWGEATIPVANTFIPFRRSYFRPPEVNITLKGGANPSAIPKITQITREGFYVEGRDTVSGSLLSITFSWASNGY